MLDSFPGNDLFFSSRALALHDPENGMSILIPKPSIFKLFWSNSTHKVQVFCQRPVFFSLWFAFHTTLLMISYFWRIMISGWVRKMVVVGWWLVPDRFDREPKFTKPPPAKRLRTNHSRFFIFRVSSVCDAQDITKYKWVFKLIHSTEVKTLFFAVDTEFDLKVTSMHYSVVC